MTEMSKSIRLQVALIAVLLTAFAALVSLGPLEWDSEVSIASMIAIPAAVIAVAQLITVNRVQRAGYIKDYALRFLADTELNESFHCLVVRYGNDEYRRFKNDPEAVLGEQQNIDPGLRYFDPKQLTGSPQERRMDKLLGFFDTLGYDYRKDLVDMPDIAGVFGLQLDHFLQREPVQEYIKAIEEGWPKLEAFHTRYKAPLPFRYFTKLCSDYAAYQRRVNPEESK